MGPIMQSNMKLSSKGNKTEYEYDEESVYSSDNEYDSDTLTDFEEEILSKLPPARKSLIDTYVGCGFKVQRAPIPVYIPAGFKYPKINMESLIPEKVINVVEPEPNVEKVISSTKKWAQTSNNNTKVDVRHFPNISDAFLIQKLEKSINKYEWIEVTTNKHQQKSEKSEKQNIRTKLCQSVIDKTECKHGSKCRFAHSESELTKKECSYGTRCSFIHLKNSGIYVNKKGRDRICMFSHPGESSLNYIERITAKEDACSVSSQDKPVSVTPKKIAVVKEKVQPKVCKPKVIKFKKESDETERIRKRNNINIEIRTVQASIKQKESAYDRLSKVKSDNNKLYTDKLLVDIKTQKEKLKQLEKDYAYFSVVRKETIVDDKEIVEAKTPIVVSEKPKSKSQLNAEKLNLLKKAEAEKKAVAIKADEPKKKCTIGFSYSQIVGPSEKVDTLISVPSSPVSSVKNIENVVSTTDRDDAFNILKDKTKISNTLLKTKLCLSVSKGVKCQYGSKCKFAHNSSELSISKCLFGKSCIFVENTNDVYKNKLGKKICEHLHPSESESNFYLRIGIKTPSKKVEVKPEIKKNTFSMNAAPWAPKKETIKEEKVEIKTEVKKDIFNMNAAPWDPKEETIKEDGWVEVKTKKENKKQEVAFKTRMCNNIVRSGDCKYIDCKYAHSPNEIMICNFDVNCKYKNTTCYRVHSCESNSQFIKRIQNM